MGSPSTLYRAMDTFPKLRLLRFTWPLCLCLIIGVLGDAGDDLRAQIAEKEFESQVEAHREQEANEDKGSLVAGLMEVMNKLKELESNPPAPTQDPVKNEKVEEAVRAFEQSMKPEGAAEPKPLEDDELRACALMSIRRFGGSAEAQTLLQRFSDEQAVSPGEASKSTVFKGIVVCLKTLSKDALADFHTAGGFAVNSQRSLPDAMAQEAESKKSAVPLQGEVFQLGFNKPKWALLRRLIAAHHSPKVVHEEVHPDKTEL